MKNVQTRERQDFWLVIFAGIFIAATISLVERQRILSVITLILLILPLGLWLRSCNNYRKDLNKKLKTINKEN